MSKRTGNSSRALAGLSAADAFACLIALLGTVLPGDGPALAGEFTPCDVNPCQPWCPDPDCNPLCGGSMEDPDCLLSACSGPSGDCQASCCPCDAGCEEHGADVSVWPDLTWIGDVVTATVCSGDIDPMCSNLLVQGAEFTTHDFACPLKYSAPVPPPLAEWLYTPSPWPIGPCVLSPYGEDWDSTVYLPDSYTFSLSPYTVWGCSIDAGTPYGTYGHRVFSALSLDLALANGSPPYTAFPEKTPLEDQEPSYYLGVNDDFGEGKPTEDWEDPSPISVPHLPGEAAIASVNDMVRLYLDLIGLDLTTCGSGRVSVRLWAAPANWVRLLAINPDCLTLADCGGDPLCPNCYEVITFSRDIAPDYLLGSRSNWLFYLEGLYPGTVVVTADGTIDGDPNRRRIDEILFKVVKIDADVDSDNTKTAAPFGPDGSIDEDRIEDSADLPGRIILVNDDDDDNDGVVDYGDGYDLNPHAFIPQDNSNEAEDDFIEMKLRVPAPVDLAIAEIRVTYEASDPLNAAHEYGQPPEVPPISLTPAPGVLRIWTKRGSEPRSWLAAPAGDYVVPDTHPASALGLSNGTREVSLWLEGISPGQTRVVFELDPDGDGPAGFVHSDAFRVTVLKVAIVNPTAPTWVYDSEMGKKTPRIMTPAAGDSLTGNEFTYSAAYPDGVLFVPVRIQIEPDTPQIRALFENRIRTRVSPIDDSHSGHENVQLAWNSPFPGEATAGKAAPAGGSLWYALATFTKLPPNNGDFGRKTLTVDFLGVAGNVLCSPRTRDYEIFYAWGAINHPNLPGKPDLDNFSATNVDTIGFGDSTRSPNWFFYWNRTGAGNPAARFDSTMSVYENEAAFVPAGFNWYRYTGPRERILVGPLGLSDLFNTINSTGTPKTGIDAFADLILHEARHVTQVIEHNGLNPYDVATLGGARIGWSWCDMGMVFKRTRANIEAYGYNHFQAGPDGEPGTAGEDDDNPPDGEIDELDEFIAGLGDTVVGDDVDLDPDGDGWGVVATEPDPNQNADGDGITPEWNNGGWQDNKVSGPKGSQSNRAETSPQGQFAEDDWGDPGKQHGLEHATQNADGEYNDYRD